MKKRVAVILLMGLGCLVGLGGPATAQTDCQALLREVYQRANEYSDPGERVLQLTYRATSHFRAAPKDRLQTATTTFELYAARGMFYYKGADVTCAQDTRQTITVVTASRRILVGASSKELLNPVLNRQWRTLLLDSLQKTTLPPTCESVVLEGRPMHKLTLSVLPDRQARIGGQRLTLWVDVDTKFTRRMEMLHPAGSSVERTEIAFSEPQWLDDRNKLPKSAQLLAFDGKGNLLPAYRGYEVVRINKK